MERLPLTSAIVFEALLAMTCDFDRVTDDGHVTLAVIRFRQLPRTEGHLEVRMRYVPEQSPDVVMVSALNYALEAVADYLNNLTGMHPGGPLMVVVEEGQQLQAPPVFTLKAIERNPLAAWVQSVRIDVFDGARKVDVAPERKLPGVRVYLTTGRFHNNYTVRSRDMLAAQLREGIVETFDGLRLAPTIPQDIVNQATNQNFSRDPA